VSLLALGGAPGVVSGQVQDQQSLAQEAIISYVADVLVNTDNSINVTETITYNTGPQNRHGIFRDIYPRSSTGKKMLIEDIFVTDEVGKPYQYTVSTLGTNVQIKIGDPNTTFTGQKTYVIGYRATRAVAQLEELDEIYWNVTGNGWNMPIYSAQAYVALPSGAASTQSACYFGSKGSTNPCQMTSEESGVYHFSTPSPLNPQEGLTIAVGFAKGVVTPYTASDRASDFFALYWKWILSAILPISTLILCLKRWQSKWRDPKGTGVIVPQYDVPDELTPMEVSGIVYEKVEVAQISAEIIYLATKGYLKIRQLDERFLGIIKSTDYEITKLKDPSDLPNEFDRELIGGLFKKNSDTVKLSSLKNVFYVTAGTVVTSAHAALLSKKYYKNLGKIQFGRAGLVMIIFMSVWVSLFVGILSAFAFDGNPLPFILGILLSGVIFAIVLNFSPAKTEEGVAAKEYLLGLKEYLQIAEKDRLQFHNAPEKNPEVFEKLLPYAMVLGVTDIWAKEFEGVYTTPPSWYSGTTTDTFSAAALGHSMSGFTSHATSSLRSSPSRGGRGGSGGGGSSGGGGGGGGGGSW
jgi:uncharacterized membrane protein